jgi:ClpP class serine protease
MPFNFEIGNLFWVFIIFTTVYPMIQKALVEARRQAAIRALEAKRKSRVITLIHRQEALSFLGIQFARYIDIEDSEAVLRAVRLTASSKPIDLVVHTPGGLVLAAEQIAHALIRHGADVTVFVPHYAMSGGTLIAMAADHIVMDPNAVLGPVDPQLGQYPAASIVAAVDLKPIDKVDDQTLILADVARKALGQVRQTVVEILTGNHMDRAKAERIADLMSTGRWTHDYPISCEEARQIGLPVREDLPDEVYDLIELYPQSGARRPSVQYIPVPYTPEPAKTPKERSG